MGTVCQYPSVVFTYTDRGVKMMNMSGQAVAAYIDALIEADPELTLTKVQRNAGVGMNYVSRLRTKDTQNPSTRITAALIRAARGNLNDVARLSDPETTAEMGQKAALEWLEQNAGSEKRRKEAVALIDELLNDPRKLDRWLGYGRRLLEESENQ